MAAYMWNGFSLSLLSHLYLTLTLTLTNRNRNPHPSEGLRLDHLFNARDGANGARSRLERDMKTYWGALKDMGVDEKQVREVGVACEG